MSEEPEEPIDFELSEDDLEAIAGQKSKVVPNLPPEPGQRTPFTIENAPMAKRMIMPHEMIPPPQILEVPLQELDEGEQPPQQQQRAE